MRGRKAKTRGVTLMVVEERNAVREETAGGDSLVVEGKVNFGGAG